MYAKSGGSWLTTRRLSILWAVALSTTSVRASNPLGTTTGAISNQVATPGVTRTPAPTSTPARMSFTCSQVIGFSQTKGWFGSGFERVQGIVDAQWQLLAQGGGGIELWTDPTFSGWIFGNPNNYPVSRCMRNSTNPDRVILTISSTPNPSAVPRTARIYPKVTARDWVPDIQTVIANTRAKYSNLRQIILQPVIGGPNHQVCYFAARPVRASVNHPIVDQAISIVVGADRVGDVFAGASPEVRTCSDYADSTGHLTTDGYAAAAKTMGTFYASFSLRSEAKKRSALPVRLAAERF